MKHKVVLSTYSIIMTLALPMFLIGLLLIMAYDARDVYMLSVVSFMLIVAVCCALFYTPVSVSLEEGFLTVRRPIRSRRISVEGIASIEMCAPTMGAKTICGSGGFLGYWGRFYEKDLGKYFAYHGKASDCFLITLHDGRRYMLGCRNAADVVEAVQASL